MVATTARGRIPGEVLERRDDATGLESPSVRGTHHAREIRILAEGLLDSAPAVVAHHVHHGRERLVHPGAMHQLPDRRSHLLDDLDIERSRKRERGGKDRRAVGRETRETFLVRNSRNTEPGVGHELLLEIGKAPRPLVRSDRSRPEDARELADSKLRQRVPVARAKLVFVRRHADAVEPQPHTPELGDLLFQRHRADQSLDPIVDRHRGVLPGARGTCPPRPMGQRSLPAADGGGAVESRTTRCVASSIRSDSGRSPAAIASRVWQATLPIFTSGW